MKKYILLFCSIALLSGCAELGLHGPESGRPLEPIIVYPSFSSNYLLSCLSDMRTLDRKEFDAKFKLAEEGLKQRRFLDQLHFICLSINEKADYKQFKHGMKFLDQYFEDYPESGDDMQGFRFLVDRLDEDILNRWSAWKSLLNDKKELNVEVASLEARIEELIKQIEQLKNIENIIKSREIGQP